MTSCQVTPPAPQASDDVFFKSVVTGLSGSAIPSIVVTSDSESSSTFTDTLVSSGSGVQSSDWAALYTPVDGQTDLTDSQQKEIEVKLNLNVVHNPSAKLNLKYGKDSFLRNVSARLLPYTSQDLYSWLTADPVYGEKIRFVLDRMNFQNTTDANGNPIGWKYRLVVTPLKNSDGTPWANNWWVSDSIIYITTGLTQADAMQAALTGLALGCTRIDGYLVG